MVMDRVTSRMHGITPSQMFTRDVCAAPPFGQGTEMHDPRSVVDVEVPLAAPTREHMPPARLDSWPMLTRLVDALPDEGMLCSARGRVLHANAPARRRLADPRDARPLQDAAVQACASLPRHAQAH